MAEVKIQSIEAALKKAAERLSPPALTRISAVLAHQMLEFAIESPVPRDEGLLADSALVETQPDKGVCEFGFNKVYATFQDQLKNTGSAVVRPRVKKALYIPLTRKGRKRHRYGANPRDEGLVRGKDFVLRNQVSIPIKAYGSEKGPNHYFSETVRQRTDWFFEEFAKAVGRSLGEK